MIKERFRPFSLADPLQAKHSRRVKSELKKVFDHHGSPRILQSNRGKKFTMKSKRKNDQKMVEMTKDRPYHPQ